MQNARRETLEIKLFGGLEISRATAAAPLPQSKKTRALLAYLILKGAPQRRDALCELLWDVPDDPRGALRWSLSKLRPLVNDAQAERLTADRERVGFQRHGASVDALRLEELCAVGFEAHSTDTLRDVLRRCDGALLAGLDLPNHPAWEAWRLGQQERSRQLQLRVIDALLGRDDLEGSERTALMRQSVELDDGNVDTHVRLIEHLVAAGQRSEARAQLDVSRRLLRTAGVPDDIRLARALSGTKTASRSAAPIEPPTQLRQNIQFCSAADGTRIAFATAGHGPPLVKTANWLNHLEFDWESPVFRHLFRALTSTHTLVRYDSRGNGLSDWSVRDLSLDALVRDLEAVVDAAGVERFPLFALSQGCAVAVEFAVRHPDRVSSLILFGGYARGFRRRGDSELVARAEALITLMRPGWGSNNPAFRQIFTSLFIPGATNEQMAWFNELQRRTTSPENAARLLSAVGDFEVSHRLREVTQPTLVIHPSGDALTPVEFGRELASGIPGARFVALDGNNHLLLEDEAAWPHFLREIDGFLGEQR